MSLITSILDARLNLYMVRDDDEKNYNHNNKNYIHINTINIIVNINYCQYSNDGTCLIIKTDTQIFIVRCETNSIVYIFDPSDTLKCISSFDHIQDFALNTSEDMIVIIFVNLSNIYFIKFDKSIVYTNTSSTSTASIPTAFTSTPTVLSVGILKCDMCDYVKLMWNDKILRTETINDDQIICKYIKVDSQEIFREIISHNDVTKFFNIWDTEIDDYLFQIVYHVDMCQVLIINVVEKKSITCITFDNILCLYHEFDVSSGIHYLVLRDQYYIKHYKVSNQLLKNESDYASVDLVPFYICKYSLSSQYQLLNDSFEKILNKIYYINEVLINHQKLLIFADVYTGCVVHYDVRYFDQVLYYYDKYCLWNIFESKFEEIQIVPGKISNVIFTKPNIIDRQISFDQSLFVDLFE